MIHAPQFAAANGYLARQLLSPVTELSLYLVGHLHQLLSPAAQEYAVIGEDDPIPAA